MQASTIYECFEERVKEAPDKRAVVYLGTEWSYGEIKDLVERLAAALQHRGVKRGERIVLYLPNIPQWIVAFLAIERLSAIAVAIAPISTPTEIAGIIDDCQPETLICTDTNLGHAMSIQPKGSLKRILVTSLTGLLPWWKRFINRAMKIVPQGKTIQNEQIISFDNLLKAMPSSLPPFDGKGEDVALLCYTSGTLGVPKALPYTCRSFLESVPIPRAVSKAVVPLGEGVTLLGRPLYECLGTMTALSCLIHAGETLVVAHEYNVDAFMTIIQRYKVTHLLGSLDLLQGFLGNPRLDDYDMGSIRYCLTGGDVVPAGTAEAWVKRFRQPLYQTYTVTETCGPVSISPPEEHIPAGTAGKVHACKKVKLIDPDTMNVVPTGESGEILVSSEHMVTAYWNEPEKTSQAFVEIDGRLWFKTGDIGRLDDNGWFYFLSRNTDIIRHQGHNIVAAEIERVLEDHPAVARAAVVGIPDPNVGERIKGFLVLVPGVKGITSYQLMDWCREKLAAQMVPQYIDFRDMLPLSNTGKLLKRELVIEEQGA